MAYIVHESNTVTGIFPIEENAQAYQAHKGGTILLIENIPSWAEPGCYISDAGVLSLEPPITDAARLKRAVRAARRTLLSWKESLPEYSPPHSEEHIDCVEAFFTHGDEGLYLMTTSSIYTTDQKISFCDALIAGAADATDPAEYLAIIGSITDAQKPTGPIVWVSPPAQGADTWDRVNLSQAKTTSAGITTLSGTIPDGVLDTDAWIENLAA